MDEAKELLGYIEEDLQEAKREGDRKLVRVIQRYKGGVESYIALRGSSASNVSIASGRV